MVSDFPIIFLGCPINPGREFIVGDYLQHLYDLDYPKDKIRVGFLVNHPEGQDSTQLLKLLRNFKDKTQNQYMDVTIREVVGDYDYTSERMGRTQQRRFSYFAAIRNEWIELRGDADYIYSVDSDILIPPHSLKQLLSRDKDVISLLIENGPMYDPELHPQRIGYFLAPYNWWLYHRRYMWSHRVYNHTRVAFNVMNKSGTIYKGAQNPYDRFEYVHVDPAYLYGLSHRNYDPDIAKAKSQINLLSGPFVTPTEVGPLPEVDMVGAAYLIKRSVFDKGVRYGMHHQGEDPYFCAMAQDHGFKLYCDIFLHADHIMNPAMHQQRQNYLESLKCIQPVPRIQREGVPRYFVPVLQPEPDVEVVLREVS